MQHAQMIWGGPGAAGIYTVYIIPLFWIGLGAAVWERVLFAAAGCWEASPFVVQSWCPSISSDWGAWVGRFRVQHNNTAGRSGLVLPAVVQKRMQFAARAIGLAGSSGSECLLSKLIYRYCGQPRSCRVLGGLPGHPPTGSDVISRQSWRPPAAFGLWIARTDRYGCDAHR